MTDKPLGPAYRVHTRRLILRCWDPADAPLLLEAFDARNLDHLRPWMPWAHTPPETIDQAVGLLRQFRGEFDLGRDFVYGVFDREETRVLGGAGLHMRIGEGGREIGYWIHGEYINQGLATELAAALTWVAFEVDGVERVEIHCDPGNGASAAVARKAGFTHAETVVEESVDGELPKQTMRWVMQAEAYPASPAAEAQLEAFDAAGRRLL